ncbi:MAG: hypothetical protein M3O68_04305 [Thermoproteota archaeon]|nr:hypothetical protein [Thermoproteota archaeon]
MTSIIIAIIFSFPNIGFAQNSENTSQSGGAEVKLITPILQKISDKGTYLIAIKSGQSPISAGLNLEIVFLNKTAPYLNAPPPNAESNLSSTESNKSSGLVIPSVIERTLTVKSYDIMINSSDGKEIWKKTNQVPQGGRGPQTIVLENYDIGNITILLKNIVPSPELADTMNVQNKSNFTLSLPDTNPPTDSVEFKTKILVV